MFDITWFPNSWVRIRIEKRIIYFDPAYLTTYFNGYADKTEFSKWPNPIDGLPNGLEMANYIFITHHHKDHCKKVTVNRLSNNQTKIYAPKSCEKELGDNFIQVNVGDNIEIESELFLRVLYSYNTEKGTSTKKQHKKGKGVGYILTIKGLTFYHLGDTDYFPEMKALDNIDIAFVPMGGKFTMDKNEAVEATKAINPKIVIPIHNLGNDFKEFENGLNGSRIRCIIPTIGKIMKI